MDVKSLFVLAHYRALIIEVELWLPAYVLVYVFNPKGSLLLRDESYATKH